ncbi:hypothetical protein IFR05_009769 [Cadophora sp. M221]|nr:hypothetical protein IFR05_009769 [Cadophora sp. M221]
MKSAMAQARYRSPQENIQLSLRAAKFPLSFTHVKVALIASTERHSKSLRQCSVTADLQVGPNEIVADAGDKSIDQCSRGDYASYDPLMGDMCSTEEQPNGLGHNSIGSNDVVSTPDTDSGPSDLDSESETSCNLLNSSSEQDLISGQESTPPDELVQLNSNNPIPYQSCKQVTLFCGNLLPHTTEAILAAMFQEYSSLDSIHLKSEEGYYQGFAYILLDDDREAEHAKAQMQGATIEGEPMILQRYPESQEQSYMATKYEETCGYEREMKRRQLVNELKDIFSKHPNGKYLDLGKQYHERFINKLCDLDLQYPHATDLDQVEQVLNMNYDQVKQLICRVRDRRPYFNTADVSITFLGNCNILDKYESHYNMLQYRNDIAIARIRENLQTAESMGYTWRTGKASKNLRAASNTQRGEIGREAPKIIHQGPSTNTNRFKIANETQQLETHSEETGNPVIGKEVVQNVNGKRPMTENEVVNGARLMEQGISNGEKGKLADGIEDGELVEDD